MVELWQLMRNPKKDRKNKHTLKTHIFRLHELKPPKTPSAPTSRLQTTHTILDTFIIHLI